MGLRSRFDCLIEYGSDYAIQKKIDTRELIKVGRGLYSSDKCVPKLAVIAFRYPKAVVTMQSAFYIHRLTDTIPDKYSFATGRNASKIRESSVRQYFVPSDFFEQGTEITNYKGYPIRIYNMERMLIELLRYKGKLPFDYYKEVLRNYKAVRS